ncbi:unnamed protein product [Durusdinium trenchii]|uniref:Protein C10 n=1 Tax=Durusdinium trenchii TaxID=1381693 RepID=A0ABP0PH38_9DINO
MFESSRFFVVQARYFLLLCLGGKSLTREGAAEVLEDLLLAYSDVNFVQRVDKLSQDVLFDAREFAPRLARLSFEAQEPILAKWGFEASIAGAQELRQAIKEQTARDADLKELSDKVGFRKSSQVVEVREKQQRTRSVR